MKHAKKLVSVLTLTAFLAFTTPVVYAQNDNDRDRTEARTAGDDDGDDGDEGKWGLAGLLGLLGLLGLKRRDNDNHTRRS
jgi:MYXO-CTERM domain-containing protein